MQFVDSVALRQHLAPGPVIVSFSRGKDAIAAALALRESGIETRLFHLDLVPAGVLHFIDDSITELERSLAMGPILRLPHPSLYRMLGEHLFADPVRIARLVEAGVIDVHGRVNFRAAPTCWSSSLEYEDVEAYAREHFGLPEAYIATGVRAADSPRRLVAMKRWGPIQAARKLAHVVYDWRVDDVQACIRRHEVRLPVDYRWFGRSFDGIDYRFTAPLRDHAPDDFARLCEWFPLIPADLFRRERVCKGAA